MRTKHMVYLGIILLIVTFLSVSLTSASIGDWFKRITGRATSDTTVVNITISNTAPLITTVPAVSAQDPVEDSIRNFVILFTAYDDDGTDDLNNDSAQARLQNSGTIRSNTTCVPSGSAFGNSQNYSCVVALWYFDANAAWTINVTINDTADARAENSTTTTTLNLLTSMKMWPTSLTWGSVTITSTNVGSNNDPITINNTGNDDITNITVKAIDLSGETTSTQYIYAGNFTVNTVDAADNTTMVNGTAIQVQNANFTRGNHSVNDGSTGQEQLYFYLEAVNPDLTAQPYSTSGGGEWTVAITT